MSFVYIPFWSFEAAPFVFYAFFLTPELDLGSIGCAYFVRTGTALRHFVLGNDSLGTYDLLIRSSDIGMTR